MGILRFLADRIQQLDPKQRAEHEALRVAEAKFAGVVAIASDAIISVDADQRVINFNRGAEEIFGYTVEEVIGKPLDMLLPNRYQRGHHHHVSTFGESAVPARRMGERGEISGRRKSGEEFPAEASISKVDVAGERIYTAIVRDVTERKRLEEAQQAAINARDDVLAVVSHDLGNPLSAIRIGTTLLLKSVPAEERETGAWKHIVGIRNSAEQMERLIKDLLEVKRIEAGQLSVERDRVAVAPLITEAVELHAAIAQGKRVSLETSVDGTVAAVYADRERLLQTFSNLLGNAVKFTPEGGTVRLSARSEADQVTFCVADTGVGIVADDVPHVFDRYWQAQSRKRGRQGIGLGLVIVKGIVEAHGGRVWLTSDVGKGTTVSFTIPAWANQIEE